VDLINSCLGTDLKPIYRENPIKNYVMHTQADTSKMQSLGLSSIYSLEDGLKEIMG